MSSSKQRVFDLQERTLKFALHVRDFIKKVPRSLVNIEYLKQLARSSGSVGANYTEANDALGRNDFLVKVKTSRREAKETSYWLQLIDIEVDLEKERRELLDEASQLVKIFSSILQNAQLKAPAGM